MISKIETLYYYLQYAVFRKKAIKLPTQVFLWFEPYCNLRCQQCAIWHNQPRKEITFNLERKKKIVRKIYDWLGNKFTLNLLGGELFLYKDKILELVRYTSSLGIKTSITTNGTLLTREICLGIIKSRLHFLSFSLDALTPSLHEEIRGRKNIYPKIIDNIFCLKRLKGEKRTPVIYISTIIMKKNLSEIIPLVYWIKEKGLDGITFQPIVSVEFFNGPKLGPFWFKRSPFWPSFKEVEPIILKVIELKKEGYPVKNSISDLRKILFYFKDPIKFARKEKCVSGINSLTVTPTGELKLCPIRSSLGSVLREDLDERWRSFEAFLMRKEIGKCERQCKALSLNKDDFYF